MFTFVTNVYEYLYTGCVSIYICIHIFTAKIGLFVLSFGWLAAVTYNGSYKAIKKTFWRLYVVGNEGLQQKKSNFILHLTFSAVLAVYFGVFPTFPTALCVFHFLQYFVLFNRLSFRSGRLNTGGGFSNRCGGAPSSRCS